jgi:hypothetical protein
MKDSKIVTKRIQMDRTGKNNAFSEKRTMKVYDLADDEPSLSAEALFYNDPSQRIRFPDNKNIYVVFDNPILRDIKYTEIGSYLNSTEIKFVMNVLEREFAKTPYKIRQVSMDEVLEECNQKEIQNINLVNVLKYPLGEIRNGAGTGGQSLSMSGFGANTIDDNSKAILLNDILFSPDLEQHLKSVILHEMLHAIGLKHPNKYSSNDELPFDSGIDHTNSVMSYRNQALTKLKIINKHITNLLEESIERAAIHEKDFKQYDLKGGQEELHSQISSCNGDLQCANEKLQSMHEKTQYIQASQWRLNEYLIKNNKKIKKLDDWIFPAEKHVNPLTSLTSLDIEAVELIAMVFIQGPLMNFQL